jgi:hypothetical protein
LEKLGVVEHLAVPLRPGSGLRDYKIGGPHGAAVVRALEALERACRRGTAPLSAKAGGRPAILEDQASADYDGKLAVLSEALGHPWKILILRHLPEDGPMTPTQFIARHRLTVTVGVLSHHFRRLERLGVIRRPTIDRRGGSPYEIGGPHAVDVVAGLKVLEAESVPPAGSVRAEGTGLGATPGYGVPPGDGPPRSLQLDWRKIVAPQMSRLEVALLELPEGTDFARLTARGELVYFLPKEADLDLTWLSHKLRSFRRRGLDQFVGRRPIDWHAIGRIVLAARRFGILEVLALDGGRCLTTGDICFELNLRNRGEVSTEMRLLREAGWVALGRASSVDHGRAGYLYGLHQDALASAKVGEPTASWVDKDRGEEGQFAPEVGAVAATSAMPGAAV